MQIRRLYVRCLPNTHLNSVGYDKVIAEFFNLTRIRLSKRQTKNKWDKLKPEFLAWKKLMRKQTGPGWDRARGVIDMDDEWWKKAKAVSPETILFMFFLRKLFQLVLVTPIILFQEIPSCGKFRKKTIAK
jgi:hypothetical protein